MPWISRFPRYKISGIQDASGFSDTGLAKIVGIDGKHALMDTTSCVVLSLKENCEIAEWKEGSRVTKFKGPNGKEALINAAGNIVSNYYDHIVISSTSHLNPFCRDGLWGYLDDHGEEVIANIYRSIGIH